MLTGRLSRRLVLRLDKRMHSLTSLDSCCELEAVHIHGACMSCKWQEEIGVNATKDKYIAIATSSHSL